jgi:hypothetical protein
VLVICSSPCHVARTAYVAAEGMTCGPGLVAEHEQRIAVLEAAVLHNGKALIGSRPGSSQAGIATGLTNGYRVTAVLTVFSGAEAST